MTSTSQHVQRSTTRRGEPAVVARYADLATARRAVETLENKGVDGDDIVLAGWRARAARRSGHVSAADRELVRYVARKAVLGIAVGAVVGVIVGALAGAVIAWAWSGSGFPGWGVLIGAGALAIAALGSRVGAMVDVERHAGFSDAWGLTLQDVPDGSVWILLFDDSSTARVAIETTAPEEFEVR